MDFQEVDLVSIVAAALETIRRAARDRGTREGGAW
jgi:hypothetical protein